MAAKPSAQLPLPGQVQTVQARVIGILGTAALLALLYFGREVLIPITLAVMLSLLVAPMIHGLRRIGLGQTASVWAVVLALVLVLSAIATVIGSQLIRMGASMPRQAGDPGPRHAGQARRPHRAGTARDRPRVAGERKPSGRPSR